MTYPIDRDYQINRDEDMIALGHALRGFRFSAEFDENDPGSVREMLSDIDWYKTRWEPGLAFKGQVRYHPVAGSDGAWDVYMTHYDDIITLTTP